MENAPELKPAVIKGMSEVMFEMMGPDAAAMFGMDEMPQDEKMYVATVPDKIAGAGVIAYQNFMDEAAERVGGDFFILLLLHMRFFWSKMMDRPITEI